MRHNFHNRFCPLTFCVAKSLPKQWREDKFTLIGVFGPILRVNGEFWQLMSWSPVDVVIRRLPFCCIKYHKRANKSTKIKLALSCVNDVTAKRASLFSLYTCALQLLLPFSKISSINLRIIFKDKKFRICTVSFKFIPFVNGVDILEWWFIEPNAHPDWDIKTDKSRYDRVDRVDKSKLNLLSWLALQILQSLWSLSVICRAANPTS